METEIKLQTCNLCLALCRNISENFKSVSFEFVNNDEIQVKIVLSMLSDVEEDLIDDLIAEFAALQDRDCVRPPIIEIGNAIMPLKNLVYKAKEL